MNGKHISTVVAGFVLALAVDAAVANGGHGATVTQNQPVSWTITSAACPSLPAGTVIEGTGIRADVINTHGHGSITQQVWTTHAYGSATDQLGNSYTWDYSSTQNDANTAPSVDWFGSFVDHFSLAGNGPSHILAGFVADIAHDTDYTYFIFTPRQVIGDPIGFDDLSFHCDPM